MQPPRRRQTTAALALLALGVVYGDIGTSPLYAAKETFNPDARHPADADNILGGVSAIFWSLMIVVSLKYVTLVLRADNRGEGGIMALLALATSSVRDRPRLRALLLADRRVRRRAVLRRRGADARRSRCCPRSKGWRSARRRSSPTSCRSRSAILVALFAIQRHGTGVVGLLFGPVCALWFVALGAAGIWNIAQGAGDPRARSIRAMRCAS